MLIRTGSTQVHELTLIQFGPIIALKGMISLHHNIEWDICVDLQQQPFFTPIEILLN